MGIKALIKSNTILRRVGKKIKIYNEFMHDAKSFSDNYLENAERQGDYQYQIMLIVHSLEKGMCMTNPRPFGQEKVKNLMNFLERYTENQQKEFEYRLGISILFAWQHFFAEHGWQNDPVFIGVEKFLDGRNSDGVQAGCFSYKNPIKEYNFDEYEQILLSRHSVRDFQKRELDMQDVEFAIKCFIEAPTACNRQMCRVYYVTNQSVKTLLDETIIGTPGFNMDAVHYFLVTYDLAAFAYSGERQQGLFNAGLCTMNFINGLHARGIGSCCLQWSNKHAEDVIVRQKLGLKKSERIAVVIGAGYYLDENIIPCSVRKERDEIFKVI